MMPRFGGSKPSAATKTFPRGAVAQLAERRVRNAEAVGSIPTSSTETVETDTRGCGGMADAAASKAVAARHEGSTPSTRTTHDASPARVAQ